jgi:uncharacterized protein
MARPTSKTPRAEPDFFLQRVPYPAGEHRPRARPAPDLLRREPRRLRHHPGRRRDELDFQIGDETQLTRYEGADGVGIGSYLRRIAFALRFGEYNPLISDFITSDSKIHYIRDVRERAQTLAPFLSFDADPYPVVLDGRIKWIIDAYTTTDRYPYGAAGRHRRAPGGQRPRPRLQLRAQLGEDRGRRLRRHRSTST